MTGDVRFFKNGREVLIDKATFVFANRSVCKIFKLNVILMVKG
jgi:hypothetical protein